MGTLKEEHDGLIAITKDSLRKYNWLSLVLPDFTESFPNGLDLMVIRPVDGAKGVLCHARRNTKVYNLSKPQADIFFQWKMEVYVVYENSRVIPINDFQQGTVLPPYDSRSTWYYQLDGDHQTQSFRDTWA